MFWVRYGYNQDWRSKKQQVHWAHLENEAPKASRFQHVKFSSSDCPIVPRFGFCPYFWKWKPPWGKNFLNLIKTNWTWTDVITLNHLLILSFTIGGFDYFAEAYPDAKVYAHKTLQGYMQQLLNVRNKITQKRAVFQFGTELSDKEHENSGIGIRLKLVGFFCSSKVEKI